MTRSSLRSDLLRWYDAHARDLPWRRTRDPYAVWVSEVMLQQTRVETVVPYYERFMARFPTPKTLAEAPEDDVLALWSGLGYYRRARLLHSGVRDVVARYGGSVPSDPDVRRSLPGVGRYTAGAIGSIAFDRPEAIVDGNIARVLSRLHRIETRLGLAVTERRLWREANELVRGRRPGALNQALMELGATVCTPKKPRCLECPAQPMCQARQDGVQDTLPVPRKKAPPRAVETVVVAPLTATQEIWLLKQDTNLFGGLWALPMTRGTGLGEAKRALSDAGLIGTIDVTPAGQVTHTLSHRRISATVFRAMNVTGATDHERQPFSPGQLEGVGISRFTNKALALIQDAPARDSTPRRTARNGRPTNRKT